MKKKSLLPLVLFLIALAAVTVAVSLTVSREVSAQAPVPTQLPSGTITDNDVNRVAKKLYCPVCPNTPLDVCETQACKDWRLQIREQLASGWTDKQVMDYFVMQYGERVLAEPERGGFTSLVWMLPVLVAALGLIVVWLILKSWRSGQKSTAAAVVPQAGIPPAVSQEVLAKIEAEIRAMD
jgi:cytochrome c-type biogenesis protein CcmH